MNSRFGRVLRSEFSFEDDAVFLNNGSYGSVPKAVQDYQKKIKAEMERHPDSFFRRRIPQLWRETVSRLGEFLRADPKNLVLVDNVTTGLNAVVRSLLNAGELVRGDAILITSLQYNQVRVFCEQLTKDVSGLEIRKLELNFPLNSGEEIVQKYADYIDEHPEIKLAILDHISSPASVLIPVPEIAAVCRQRRVITAVDGAHVVGQLPLNFEEMGVDFYTSNLHKWAFTARGSGFLWVDPRWHDITRPAVVSHFYANGFQAAFCIRGTTDNSALFTLPAALTFISNLGGVDVIRDYITDVADKAARHLVAVWGTEELQMADELKAPFMRLVRLPTCASYPANLSGCSDLETDLHERHRIQVLLTLLNGQIWTRLSAAIYTDMQDFERLGAAVLELSAAEEKTARPDKGYRMPLMHWDMSPIFSTD